jgi:type IV pilus assembly protein PilN
MIRINLAPPRERFRPGVSWPAAWPPLGLGSALGAAAIVIVVGIGGYAWSLFGEERRLTVEIDTGAREVATLTTAVGPAAKMKENLADLKARLNVINSLTKDQNRPLFLIDAFADAVPADLWITGLEDKGAVLRVTGAALSATAVSNLMTALRASGRFKEVDIIVSKRDLDKTPNLVTFEVTCRFET